MAGVVTTGAGVVTTGAGVVSTGAGVITTGAGVVTTGAGVVTTGAGMVTTGAGVVTTGAGVVTTGAGVVTTGAGVEKSVADDVTSRSCSVKKQTDIILQHFIRIRNDDRKINVHIFQSLTLIVLYGLKLTFLTVLSGKETALFLRKT